ncbi:hypothetical protein VTL71DRAFT_1745 [Oculimacula yallundae]|uniref:DUF7580 domain-containing protein n=1 Tax=Oculimacula yallundae TaxID=86028 RepID=A0ABR4CDI1_9HELO
MSGVEIAGFVLASIPLMISALEHYRETAEVLEGWWKIKREYTKCMRNLKYHKVAFEENLEELLLPLIADEMRLQELLRDPGGPSWQDPALEAMLKERMPKTYASYLDTMETMKETIQDLEEALGMSKIHFQARVSESFTSSGTLSILAHVTSNIEFHSQRIKLAFNKGPRQQLFDDFGDHNTRLRDILGSSDRLATLRRTRVSNKSAAAHAGMWKFWSHGNLLFNLLTEAWSCRCQAFHQANLLLQHRMSPTVNFRVIFWFKTHLSNEHAGTEPWTWQDTSIKLLEEKQPATITLTVPLMTAATPTLMAQSPIHSLPPAKVPVQVTVATKTVQKSSRRSLMTKLFHHKTPYSLSSVASSKQALSKSSPSTPISSINGAQPSVISVPRVACTNPVVPSSVVSPSESALVSNGAPPKAKVSFAVTPESSEDLTNPRITNLCEAIATCSSDHSYGCLRGDTRQYIVHPLCKADDQPQKCVTLETLLSKSSPIVLSRRQRLQIALILASSHVQLHPTPWLKSKWSKKDILFLYDAQDPSKIKTDQPYISRSLSRAIQTHNNTEAISTNSYAFQDSIRNLGIMLLELCFGAAIEEHKMRRDMPLLNELSLQLVNYATATEWARDVVEEAGPEYSDAVTWCLHHTPESVGADGLEDRWREDMFMKVVEPLKNCHDQLMAIPT